MTHASCLSGFYWLRFIILFWILLPKTLWLFQCRSAWFWKAKLGSQLCSIPVIQPSSNANILYIILIYVSFTSLVCLLDAVKLARNQYVTNVPTSILTCQFKIHFAAFPKTKNGCFWLSFRIFLLEATCEKESWPSGIQHPQQLSWSIQRPERLIFQRQDAGRDYPAQHLSWAG